MGRIPLQIQTSGLWALSSVSVCSSWRSTLSVVKLVISYNYSNDRPSSMKDNRGPFFINIARSRAVQIPHCSTDHKAYLNGSFVHSFSTLPTNPDINHVEWWNERSPGFQREGFWIFRAKGKIFAFGSLFRLCLGSDLRYSRHAGNKEVLGLAA